MSQHEVKPFRLAMRHEGDWWVGYIAAPDTMEGATEVLRVKMTMVATKAARDAVIKALQVCVDDVTEGALGVRPHRHDIQPAPEHERGGNA